MPASSPVGDGGSCKKAGRDDDEAAAGAEAAAEAGESGIAGAVGRRRRSRWRRLLLLLFSFLYSSCLRGGGVHLRSRVAGPGSGQKGQRRASLLGGEEDAEAAWGLPPLASALMLAPPLLLSQERKVFRKLAAARTCFRGRRARAMEGYESAFDVSRSAGRGRGRGRAGAKGGGTKRRRSRKGLDLLSLSPSSLRAVWRGAGKPRAPGAPGAPHISPKLR
jgi:hypothetical protein